MTSEIKPEDVKLPEPYLKPEFGRQALFTADQVRAAVLEATMAERERCAKLCEEFGYPLESVSFFLECAAAIRSGK